MYRAFNNEYISIDVVCISCLTIYFSIVILIIIEITNEDTFLMLLKLKKNI